MCARGHAHTQYLVLQITVLTKLLNREPAIYLPYLLKNRQPGL